MAHSSMHRPLLPHSTCRHCQHDIVLAPAVDWVHTRPSADLRGVGVVTSLATMCTDGRFAATPDPEANVTDLRLRLGKGLNLELLVNDATPLPVDDDHFIAHRPGVMFAIGLAAAISLIIWIPAIIMLIRIF